MTFFQRGTTRVIGLFQVDALQELFMALIRMAAMDHGRHLTQHRCTGQTIHKYGLRIVWPSSWRRVAKGFSPKRKWQVYNEVNRSLFMIFNWMLKPTAMLVHVRGSLTTSQPFRINISSFAAHIRSIHDLDQGRSISQIKIAISILIGLSWAVTFV